MGVLVVADDFTGANATGVLMRKKGMETITFLDRDKLSNYKGNAEVLCVNTDSRAIDATTAKERAGTIISENKHRTNIICKRIDSTLRGNIGAEIEGMLENLEDGYKAIIVPSFPDSGRIVINDYMLVNLIPLQFTPVAKDPKTPISASKVTDIIKKGTKMNIKHIPLEKVYEGDECLVNLIKKSKEKLILIDATTNEHIEAIASATINSGIKFITVDPGPFTAAVTTGLKEKHSKSKKLFLIGSVTEITRSQVNYFAAQRKVDLYNVNAKELINSPESTVRKVVDYLKSSTLEYLCVTTSLEESKIINLKDMASSKGISEHELSCQISKGLANIGKSLKEEEVDFDFVYVSGGDVTQEFFKTFGAEAFKVEKEIIPLAVLGRIVGGTLNNTLVATKGGLIGDEKTLEYIVKFIEVL